jgi:hypothetical protein
VRIVLECTDLRTKKKKKRWDVAKVTKEPKNTAAVPRLPVMKRALFKILMFLQTEQWNEQPSV